MTATSTIAPARHAPELLGQTVVVIGGSAGISRSARATRQASSPAITKLFSEEFERRSS